MGGADPDNLTLKVIKALNNLNDTDLEARILVGPSNANIESLKKELSLSVFNFQLLTSANNVTSFMVWADVTISAGGSTCWELAFMGLPFLTIILADNQEGIAEGLERAGVAINCDWFHNLKPDLISQHLLKVLPDATDRINMSIKGKNIIDGFGVDRVIEEMKVLE
jgi:spore coat polysaccharide biosynthesis predicted glycosyltransferase SpsG